MYLISFQNRFPLDKSGCPDECAFKKLQNTPVVLIPALGKMKMMLVSRDPTDDFVPIYEYSNRFQAEERRRMLFANAIPYSLIAKIIRFMGTDNLKLEERETLFKLFDCTYWTHLHKCPTNGGKDSRAFYRRNGKACANEWLSKEIEAALHDGVETVVCLGNDVIDWYRNSSIIKRLEKVKKIEKIELPHPSNQNNRYWYRSNDRYKNKARKIERELKRLLKILREMPQSPRVRAQILKTNRR